MAANGNGAGRLGLYASIFMAMVVIFGAFMWVGSIASQVQQNQAALLAQEKRLEAQTEGLRQNVLLTSNITRDLRETETQFCASDIVRNLMHANDMRTIAMLWKKSFGTDYPTNNAYYPTICNRPTISQ